MNLTEAVYRALEHYYDLLGRGEIEPTRERQAETVAAHLEEHYFVKSINQ